MYNTRSVLFLPTLGHIPIACASFSYTINCQRVRLASLIALRSSGLRWHRRAWQLVRVIKRVLICHICRCPSAQSIELPAHYVNCFRTLNYFKVRCFTLFLKTTTLGLYLWWTDWALMDPSGRLTNSALLALAMSFHGRLFRNQDLPSVLVNSTTRSLFPALMPPPSSS